MSEVGFSASQQVVDCNNGITIRQQCIAKMRPQESSTTRYHRALSVHSQKFTLSVFLKAEGIRPADLEHRFQNGSAGTSWASQSSAPHKTLAPPFRPQRDHNNQQDNISNLERGQRPGISQLVSQ